MRYKTLLLLSILIVTACAPKANPNTQIQQAVAATLSAIPTATANPIPTPYPAPTPFDLKGLFCEYQFCIGHPIEMAFYDVSAVTSNQGSPNTYQSGLMAAYNGNLLIQLMWQLAPGSSDPQFMLDLVLDDVDTRVGTLDVKLIRDMNVIYIPITSTATPVLPFGAAGAWICGDRAFAWKVYSPQAENTQSLFDMALDRFTCNR
jgi:hypothetical protein